MTVTKSIQGPDRVSTCASYFSTLSSTWTMGHCLANGFHFQIHLRDGVLHLCQLLPTCPCSICLPTETWPVGWELFETRRSKNLLGHIEARNLEWQPTRTSPRVHNHFSSRLVPISSKQSATVRALLVFTEGIPMFTRYLGDHIRVDDTQVTG